MGECLSWRMPKVSPACAVTCAQKENEKEVQEEIKKEVFEDLVMRMKYFYKAIKDHFSCDIDYGDNSDKDKDN
ncbi:hypothetical protein Pmani_011134 [Petrolisthes manimaculis]|uniref:Uncharacterized protein n=1 Tax=Petrolisthes manimaculis TaxID=1843537 RepID=A0AAE1UFZ9_9EUCA|nr:hypothetical protein Pmani_011134 [Petrolisthes manimaculis]